LLDFFGKQLLFLPILANFVIVSPKIITILTKKCGGGAQNSQFFETSGGVPNFEKAAKFHTQFNCGFAPIPNFQNAEGVTGCRAQVDKFFRDRQIFLLEIC
jgi:hypothetical protein